MSPSTCTVPPVWPVATPVADKVPATLTTPVCPPLNTIMPLRSTAESARITPVWLITVASASPTALASTATCPPLAVMLPLLVMAALAAAASTEKRTRPTPEVSSVTREPVSSPTEPASAVMVPVLLTLGAASST